MVSGEEVVSEDDVIPSSKVVVFVVKVVAAVYDVDSFLVVVSGEEDVKE